MVQFPAGAKPFCAAFGFGFGCCRLAPHCSSTGWMKGISFITIWDFMWWRYILIKTSSTGSEWTIPPAPTGSTTTETFYQACSQSEEFLSNQRSENTCHSISQLCRTFKSSLLWLYWTTSPWNLWSVLCPIMFLLVFCYCSLSFCRGSHFP